MKCAHIVAIIFCGIILFSLCQLASAHPGRTDANGGHIDHSTGEYHYHHGYSAHDHCDMDGDGDLDCPYNFDDKTGTDSGSSDVGTSGTESDNGPTLEQDSFSWDLLFSILALSGLLCIFLAQFLSSFAEKLAVWIMNLGFLLLGLCFISIIVGSLIVLISWLTKQFQ